MLTASTLGHTVKAPRPTKNAILDCVPQKEFEQLAPGMFSLQLDRDQVLSVCDQELQAVYFVTCGLVSVADMMSDGSGVEVGMVGCEGLVGIQVFLGSTIATAQTVVQVAGSALKLGTKDAVRGFESCPAFRKVVLHYINGMLVHAAKSASCNQLHEVEQRLARCLLTIADRLNSQKFYLTHEYLALMLGTRRSTVTQAAQALQEAGALEYMRGNIHILDKEKLEQMSCECYRYIANQIRGFLQLSCGRPPP
jgi:CRP-like cAMP-binding protein